MRRPLVFLVCLVLLTSTSSTSNNQIITTVAGGGPDHIPAIAANVAGPNWLARGPSGEILVSDWGSSRVFRIDTAGTLEVVAGLGVPAGDLAPSDGGPATAAVLLYPSGVAMDQDHNTYILDCDMNRIRRVDAVTGIITTFAGNGIETGEIDGPGGDASDDLGDGGPATSATLGYQCLGLGIDASGNVLFSDQGNQRVRRVDAVTGVVTTIAGGGGLEPADGVPAVDAALVSPLAVTVGPAGSAYFVDQSRVWRVEPVSGLLTVVAGNGNTTGNTDGPGGDPADDLGDGGPAVAATLSEPLGLALDAAGNLYIGDTYNSRVRRVDALTGTITTLAGTGDYGDEGDGGPAASALLARPGGLAVDASGDLLVADLESRRIRRISAATSTITAYAGNGTEFFSGESVPAVHASLGLPRGIALDQGGRLYIADHRNNRVRRLDLSGIITTVAGNGVRTHSIDGPGGDPTDDLGDGGPAAGASVYGPWAVAPDAAGNLYVADSTFRIRRIDAVTGVITTIAGTGVPGFTGDGGPATSARIRLVGGMAVDSQGNLYFSDTENNRVRAVIAATGTIITVAGTGMAGYGGDNGPAGAASLCSPAGLAFHQGTLFITDNCNHRVRAMFGFGGTIVTVAGNFTVGPGADGVPATQSSLANPLAVAVDGAGSLYIADSGSYRVRRVDASTGIIMTVAGNGTFGFAGDGGPAIDAALGWPTGVAVDGDGRIYIADLTSNRIRLVSQAPQAPPPVADAGEDRSVACTSVVGTPVTLNGSGSSSASGATLSYAWTGSFPDGGGTVTGVSPIVTLPLGRSEIALNVNDGVATSSPDTVVISVNVGVAGLGSPLEALVPEGETPPPPRIIFRRGTNLPLKLKLSCGATNLTHQMVAAPRLVALLRDGQPTILPRISFGFSGEGVWIGYLLTRELALGNYVVRLEMPDGRRLDAAFTLR